MKQKEINTLKRNFVLGNEKLNVENFAIGVISGKEMKHFKVENFNIMDETERFVYMKLLKESLGGKVGKALLEYSVPSDNFNNNSGIQRLYELNKNWLNDEEAVKELMMELVEKSLYDFPVCIAIADVHYSVPSEESEDAMEEDEEFVEENIFKFLLCNIIPLNFAEAELYFNDEKNELLRRKDENGSLVLEKKATDSIMFPVLNDRASDVNYVLYKTKDPKHPNQSIIEEFLQCIYTMSGVDEQTKITNALYGTFGEELDYEVISGMKTELQKIEYEDEENPEVTRVTVKDLSKVLSDIGYDDGIVERFEQEYEKNVGENIAVKSVNVMNTENTTFKTSGIKVTVKQKDIDKVSIERVNGRRCLVIEIDETMKVDDILVRA